MRIRPVKELYSGTGMAGGESPIPLPRHRSQAILHGLPPVDKILPDP
jgi:hypothetical protein